MASESSERSPLLTQSAHSPTTGRNARQVTFNPQTTISNPSGSAETSTLRRPAALSQTPIPTSSSPGLSSSIQTRPSLSNTKTQRRRNSHGAPLTLQLSQRPESKIGPQRTTKTAQKLKLLPNPDPGEDGPDEESGRDVYSQFTRIKDPTARRDAARLGKADRDRLPRVTAYCTSSGYRLEAMMKWLKGHKAKQRGANPKQFDECLYTPYNYDVLRRNHSEAGISISTKRSTHLHQRRFSDSAIQVDDNSQAHRDEAMDLTTSAGDTSLDTGDGQIAHHASLSVEPSPNDTSPNALDFDIDVHTPEVFLFQYGTVVIWGMTLTQEQSFLREIARFETEKLAAADIQTENFNFYYTNEYQARIYNDFISLREKRNYMTKLAISHALAQSVKTSLFEDLLSTTIATTQPLPEQIALTGSIAMSRKEIHQQIGQLFILRINIHLQGSVLDSPELFWAEPALEPVYAAVRSYLEMDQRVGLLTERLSVIGDLLAVLKDQVGTKHGEYLEWIVIVLIAAEIVVAAINIIVDLYAGVD